MYTYIHTLIHTHTHTHTHTLAYICKLTGAITFSNNNSQILSQNPILNSDVVDFVVTTEDVTLSQVQAFADKVAAMPFSQNKPLFMPILI